MNPEDIMLSDLSQREKDKYHVISPICGIKNKKQKNKKPTKLIVNRVEWGLPKVGGMGGKGRY